MDLTRPLQMYEANILAIGVLGEACVCSRPGAGRLLAPVTKQTVDRFYYPKGLVYPARLT